MTSLRDLFWDMLLVKDLELRENLIIVVHMGVLRSKLRDIQG